MIKYLLGAAMILGSAGSASAAIVDGVLDASYGDAKSVVTLNPAMASYDFGAPTQYSEQTGYSIYLSSDANNVYGFFTANTTGAGSFANIYFDLDPANGNGSDIGFEVANDRAFVAGVPGYAENLAGLNFAFGDGGKSIEFSIANAYFTGAIPGLDYQGFTGFATTGGNVVLRLSQSFNYTVAGGASYGANRLGSVTIGGDAAAVPEPASWAMMILGIGGIGAAARHRRRRTVSAYA